MSNQGPADALTQVVTVLLWAGLWVLVFALDPGFDYLADHPALLIALAVLPQLVLGYGAGPWATLCVLPLAVAWVLILDADCVATANAGGECSITVAGSFGIAAFWALILGCLIAVGYGLRAGLQWWRSHHV